MNSAITFILVISVTSANFLVHAAVYSTYDLQDYCGRTIYVDCPYTRTGSAGTLTFEPLKNNQLTQECSVEVRTRFSCGIYSAERFRFYLNIRESFLDSLATVKVFDRTTATTLEKSWQGGYLSQHYNPKSVGQMLSFGATSSPHIRIEYDNTGGSTLSSHKIVIDYVILESRSTSYNTYCSALHNYVSDDYICDTTDDRVNCPSNYEESVTTMSPALGRQSCVLSGGEIAGVVIGSVAFVILVVVIVGVCCRRKTHVRAPNTTVAFTNNPHSSAANVTIVGMAPQGLQQHYAPAQPEHPLGPPPPYPTQGYAAPMPAPKY